MSLIPAPLKDHPYKQLSTRFDAESGCLWCFMDSKPRPCFNLEILGEIGMFIQSIRMWNHGKPATGNDRPVRYTVLASRTPGVFSYGGDLALILDCIRKNDRGMLRHYARTCVDIVHAGIVGYDLPVTTISLVQGDALGGGLEAALCNHVVVAERGAQLGLPEILFNLFPGMGAYSLLAQRMDASRAEKMILSGRVYLAEELYEMGVVDVLAGSGEGEKAVAEFIGRHSRRWNGSQALLRVRRRVRPISHEELVDVSEIWVDAVFNLGRKDLRLMERLLRSQERVPDASPVAGEEYA